MLDRISMDLKSLMSGIVTFLWVQPNRFGPLGRFRYPPYPIRTVLIQPAQTAGSHLRPAGSTHVCGCIVFFAWGTLNFDLIWSCLFFLLHFLFLPFPITIILLFLFF
jgi:hypothetical protein